MVAPLSFAQAVCSRASNGSSHRLRPSSSTPSIHRASSASLFTQPSSKALSRPWDQAKAPMGKAGLTSCISPSKARSPPGSPSPAMAAGSVGVFVAVSMGMSSSVSVVMAFTVRVRTGMAMAMTVRMALAGLVVGSGFRVEGGGVVHYGGAQAFGQFFQYVVGRKAHEGALLVFTNRQGNVAVAQVVTQAGQRQAGCHPGSHHTLLGSANADDLAGFRFQQVAVPQHRAAVQEQAHVQVGFGGGPQAAANAQFVGQHQVVVDFAGVYVGDAFYQFQHLFVPLTAALSCLD